MKKVNFKVIAQIIFLVGLIGTVFIAYKKVNHPLAYPFVIGFVIYSLLYAVVIIFNSLKILSTLSKKQLFKVLKLFIKWFTGAGCVAYAVFFLVSSGNVNIMRAVNVALWCSVGRTAVEVVLIQMQDENN